MRSKILYLSSWVPTKGSSASLGPIDICEGVTRRAASIGQNISPPTYSPLQTGQTFFISPPAS